MQIVIDIPNWLYNAIMECNEPHYSKSLGDAVRDGTPLPKGHGRLIDADALNRKDVNCANVPMNFIDTASTIIEADKAESEVQE